MSEVTFERPDYCKGCKCADLRVETVKLYGFDEVHYSNAVLVCRHDEACEMWYERLKEKLESEACP